MPSDGLDRETARSEWLTESERMYLMMWVGASFVMAVGMTIADTEYGQFAVPLFYGGAALMVSYGIAGFVGVFDDD